MEKILSQTYLETVIFEANRKGKTFDLSGQTIEGFTLSDCQMRIPLFLKKTKILGQIYFYNVSFEKELNFENATLNNTFFISECQLKENLICKKISVKESINLVGNIFKKDIDLEEAQIRGFLSLNRSKIMGKANFKNINILSLEQKAGKIVGNFYFENAFLNEAKFKNLIIDGNLSLKDTTFLKPLSFSRLKIKGDLVFSNKDVLKAKLRERKKLESEQRE